MGLNSDNKEKEDLITAFRVQTQNLHLLSKDGQRDKCVLELFCGILTTILPLTAEDTSSKWISGIPWEFFSPNYKID